MTQLSLMSTRTTPRTRGECEDGVRPCPYVACRHHLWAEDERPGRPWDGKRPPPVVRAHSEHTCALDVAHDQEDRDKDGVLGLAHVGARLGITGERARQIEAEALAKLKEHGIDLELALVGRADAEADDVPERPRVRLRIVDDPQRKLPL